MKRLFTSLVLRPTEVLGEKADSQMPYKHTQTQSRPKTQWVIFNQTDRGGRLNRTHQTTPLSPPHAFSLARHPLQSGFSCWLARPFFIRTG